MEVVPGVHAVKLRSCTGYLIVEERLTLIDAGLPGSRAPLVRYLNGIGRDVSELDRIIFTGDVLQVRWGRLTYASAFFSHDYPAARAAVARLAVLEVETIALAHYGLWQRDAHARLQALAAAAS